MIYLIVADNNSIKKDCLDTWQSCNLFPGEIKEYIENTKNEQTKTERFIAYSTLFSSLEKFFSIGNPKIKRNKNGKPSLVDSNVYISLSHCDGVSAIALSDEDEIGVDIQSPVDDTKAERLTKRFLSKIHPKQEDINIKYFYMTLTDKTVDFKEIALENSDKADFLSKWVYLESVIKAYGISFSEISKINELSKNTKTRIYNYKNFKIAVTKAVIKA
jgi:phosphopantetheinyl transferase